jgi:hypothetical protein
MSISPYFLELRQAYLAEIDDLRSDSEGHDVLQQRLAAKRQEIDFLVLMMDISPEMVAVVFHQGFVFTGRAAMEQLLSRTADTFPAWSSLAASLTLAPWAQELADTVLKARGGERFMTLAAGLEFLAAMPASGAGVHDASDEPGENGDEDGAGELVMFEDDGEGEDGADSQARQEAGADWLVQQGFDQKD